jgi:predicted dehydrogenase
MTNLGFHEMDVVLWALKAKGPTAVSSREGRFGFYNDNTETPDTQDALFEFPGGCTSLFTYREASSDPPRTVQFFGTKGNLEITREYCKVAPDNLLGAGGAYRQEFPAEPAGAGGAPASPGYPWIPLGGRWRVAKPPQPKLAAAPVEMTGTADEEYVLHTRNFLDCIKTRNQPAADVEYGHQAATACHLANISLRTGRKLRWNAETEEIVGDREASSYLVRQYRGPWEDVLRSLQLGA